MSTTQIVILVVVILVVLAIVALVAMRSRAQKARRLEDDRARAQQLRQEAVTSTTSVRDSDLEAREAQIEADRAALEAEQARARAAEAQQGAQVEEARVEDTLREADRVDPDVDHRTQDYSATHAVDQDAPETRP